MRQKDVFEQGTVVMSLAAVRVLSAALSLLSAASRHAWPSLLSVPVCLQDDMTEAHGGDTHAAYSEVRTAQRALQGL